MTKSLSRKAALEAFEHGSALDQDMMLSTEECMITSSLRILQPRLAFIDETDLDAISAVLERRDFAEMLDLSRIMFEASRRLIGFDLYIQELTKKA